MQDSHLLLLSQAPEKVEDGDEGQGGRGKREDSAETCLKISANKETERETKMQSLSETLKSSENV